MGFYPQPNKWTCGPFALKHALIMLGTFVDELKIARIAGTHWWSGTDEIKLARAARAFYTDMKLIRRRDPEFARKALLGYIKKNRPCIICVDQWNHWITVVNGERGRHGRYVVIDSKAAPVVNILTWPQLRRRWGYIDKESDDGRPIYDLHPIQPRFRVTTKASFSIQRAKYLRRPENEDFAFYWDEYVSDLLTICRPRTARSYDIISMGEFLRRHEEMLVELITYWHGQVTKPEIRKVLDNMEFVADTYGLIIPRDREKRAITSIAILLSLWTAGRYGVDEFYGG
jgi:hypothetical protein